MAANRQSVARISQLPVILTILAFLTLACQGTDLPTPGATAVPEPRTVETQPVVPESEAQPTVDALTPIIPSAVLLGQPATSGSPLPLEVQAQWFDSSSYVVVLKNPNSDLGFDHVRLTIRGLDTAGNIAKEGFAGFEAVFPGQLLVASGRFSKIQADSAIDRIDVEVEEAGTALLPGRESSYPLNATNLRMWTDGELLWVSGIVANRLDSYDMPLVTVAAVVYDQDGAIIGGQHDVLGFVPGGGAVGTAMMLQTGDRPVADAARVEIYPFVGDFLEPPSPEREQIRLHAVGCWKTSSPNRWRYGITVDNLDPDMLHVPDYRITAFDDVGNVLAADADTLGVIFPSSRSAAEGELRVAAGATIARVEVQLNNEEEYEAQLARELDAAGTLPAHLQNPLSMGQLQVYAGRENSFRVTGVLANLGTGEISSLMVVGLAFDAADNIVGSWYSTLGQPIPAGSSLPVDVELPPVAATPARMELYTVIPSYLAGEILEAGGDAGWQPAAPGTSSPQPWASTSVPLTLSTAPVFPLGEVANYGDIGMFVVGWRYGEGAQPREAGHLYVVVDVIIVNNGAEAYSLWPRDSLTIRDAQGQHYAEITMNCSAGSLTPCVELANPYGSSIFRRQEAMPPGQPVRDQFVFSVPVPCPDCMLSLALGRCDDEAILVALGSTPAVAEIPTALGGSGVNVPGPGAIVTVGDLALALLKWEYVPCGVEPGTRNCVVVEAAIANRGPRPVEVSRLGLRSTTGVEYEPGYLATEPFKEGLQNMQEEPLAPGEWWRGRAVYEVTQLSTDLLLYLRTRAAGGAENPELVTALGPQPVDIALPMGFPGELAPQAVPLGQGFTVGSWTITLTKVSVLQATEFSTAPAGRSYLLLDLQVRNLGPGDQRFTLFGATELLLKGGEGDMFYLSPAVLGHLVSEELEGTIPAGGTVSGQAGFDVPTGAQRLYLVFRGRPSYGEEWSSGFVEIPGAEIWGPH